MGHHALKSVHTLPLIASCQKASFICRRAVTIFSSIGNEAQRMLRTTVRKNRRGKERVDMMTKLSA